LHSDDLLIENFESGVGSAVTFYRASTIRVGHAEPPIKKANSATATASASEIR
jgi:hypothetical protein